MVHLSLRLGDIQILWLVAICCLPFCLYGPYVHLVPHWSKATGFWARLASTFHTLLGIFWPIGGIVAQRKWLGLHGQGRISECFFPIEQPIYPYGPPLVQIFAQTVLWFNKKQVLALCYWNTLCFCPAPYPS